MTTTSTTTSATGHAVRIGLRRGWTETRLSLRAPEDIAFYMVWGVGVLIYLYANRNQALEGTDLTFPVVAMPGVLAAMTIFGGVVGPAFALVTEREDGTLLRAKAAPHGMTGYVTGQVTLQILGVVPMLAILLVPSALLFEGLMHRGWTGWLLVLAFLLLGLVTSIPLGMVIGSLARKPSHVSTWGLLPVLGLGAISGIFVPIAALWGWVQTLTQVFPMYWLGHVMRWAFLPDEAAVLELGGQWRVLEGVLVLVAWCVVGVVVSGPVLRRMARRESGSAVEARRQERMQRLG